MNIKSIVKLIIIGIIVIPINPPVVHGADMVQTVPAHNGTTKQLNPIPVPLAPGSGVSINFAPSGEIIQKVWLDNPSFITLDANGCLAGLPSSNGNCQAQDSSLIYLRRIEDLSIPGLPKTNQSLLTVVTEFQGKTNVYLFRVTKANTPSKLVFEVVANRPRNGHLNQLFTKPSTEPLVITTARITNGFKRAIANKLLEKEGNLSQQINEFIGYLESGLSKAEAAQKVGVSQAVINKLEALGR